MSNIVITVEEYYHTCGDGCCTDWGEDVTVEVDGKIVEEVRLVEFDPRAAEIALKAAGYTVTQEWDSEQDAEIITAIKEDE